MYGYTVESDNDSGLRTKLSEKLYDTFHDKALNEKPKKGEVVK